MEDIAFHFQFEPLREIELDRSPQWLISKLMPSTGLHVLYGAPGAGKSFIALNVALHVAAGRDWAGRKVHQGGVVYVASEGGRGFRKRVVAARQALDLPASTPFALITRAPRIGGPNDQTADLIADIRKQCARHQFEPRLIVLDTLSRSAIDLRESDAQDIMRFVEHAKEIGDEFDALVLPIHHCGKDASRGMRGSSALHAAADAEWLVRLDPDTGTRRILVEKMKDGAGDDRLLYNLKSVLLDRDERGEDITTCVAEVAPDLESDVPTPKASNDREPTQETKTLLGLQMLLLLQGQTPPNEVAAPPGIKVVPAVQAKEALVSAGLLPSKAKNADVAFRRALEALVDKKIVGRSGEYIWIVEAADPAQEESRAA